VGFYGRGMAYEVGGSFGVRPWRPVRAVLAVAGVVGLVCVVAVAGLVVWNVQVMRAGAGPARRAVEVFLGDVVAGDAVAAYGRLCARTRARWGREEFAARLAVPPRVSGFVVVRVRVATVEGQPRASVLVRLTRQSGVVGQRQLPVVREDGRWRVCGDPL
jgi:hypothetical protein